MSWYVDQMLGVKILNPMEIVKMNTMEVTEMKKPLVIFHANCADGFSAAWVFYHMAKEVGQEFDYHPGVYSETPPDVTDRTVYLVDFSYKRAVVEEMLKTAKSIVLIDHHKTALEDLLGNKGTVDLGPKFRAYVDLNRSGAMLAWDFWNNTVWQLVVHPEGDERIEAKEIFSPSHARYIAPPKLLEHVQDRDLWRFKLAGTREIQAGLFSMEYTFENWDKLMLGGASELMKLWQGGEAIERKHHKDIAELVKVCMRSMSFTEAGYYNMPVASLPYTLSSDAGRVLIDTYDWNVAGFNIGLFPEDKKWAACYWDTPKGRTFSLRSKEGGADVSEIAKVYGGGGHKNAAGFSVPNNHILARS